MSTFWPEGISLNDTQTPYDVLEKAREDWENRSAGVLTLALQQADPQGGNAFIIVHAKHVPSNRTETLLTVIHRLNIPYPVTIMPKKDDLPTILKKSYYEPGIADMHMHSFPKGGTVKNTWVSDTPAEFRKKLIDALNLSVVKTAILSLTSNANVPSERLEDDQEPSQD